MHRAGRVLALFLAAAALPALGQERTVSEYARFELRDIAATVKVHPKLLARLTSELKLRLDESLAAWNLEGAQPGHTGTLAVEVTITDMNFVGGRRVWASGAEDSHAAAVVKLVDPEDGRVLFSGEFREGASSTAGTYTMGAADKLMIDRLAASLATAVITYHDLAPRPPSQAANEDEAEADPPAR